MGEAFLALAGDATSSVALDGCGAPAFGAAAASVEPFAGCAIGAGEAFALGGTAPCGGSPALTACGDGPGDDLAGPGDGFGVIAAEELAADGGPAGAVADDCAAAASEPGPDSAPGVDAAAPFGSMGLSVPRRAASLSTFLRKTFGFTGDHTFSACPGRVSVRSHERIALRVGTLRA